MWESAGQDGYDLGVFGQRFSSTAALQGTEFAINSYVFGPQGVPAVGTAAEPPRTTTVADAVTAAAASLGAAPWRTRFPALLGSVGVHAEDGWRVADPSGTSLPLCDEDGLWALLALTGGEPHDVFGEIEGGSFRPLTVWHEGRVHPL